MSFPVLLGQKSGGLRPFTPLSLAPALWLDASVASSLFQNSNGTTPATADADPVGYWGDKSGNARHVTQATGTKRPVVKTGANGKNGLPIVKFDGTDDHLSLATSGLPIQTSPRWAFMVGKWIAYAGFAFMWEAGADYAMGLTTNGNIRAYLQAYYSSSGLSVLIDVWHCLGGSYGGSALSLYRNGSAASNNPITVANPTTTPAGTLWVGSFNTVSVANIEIAELIIGSGTLSAANVTALTNYANAKWGVY